MFSHKTVIRALKHGKHKHQTTSTQINDSGANGPYRSAIANNLFTVIRSLVLLVDYCWTWNYL